MSELVNAFKNSATGTLLRGLTISLIDYWPALLVAFGAYFLGYRDGTAGNNRETLPIVVFGSWMIIVSLAEHLSRREYMKGSEESLDLKKENIRLQLQLDKAQTRIDSLEFNNKINKI